MMPKAPESRSSRKKGEFTLALNHENFQTDLALGFSLDPTSKDFENFHRATLAHSIIMIKTSGLFLHWHKY